MHTHTSFRSLRFCFFVGVFLITACNTDGYTESDFEKRRTVTSWEKLRNYFSKRVWKHNDRFFCFFVFFRDCCWNVCMYRKNLGNILPNYLYIYNKKSRSMKGEAVKRRKKEEKRETEKEIDFERKAVKGWLWQLHREVKEWVRCLKVDGKKWRRYQFIACGDPETSTDVFWEIKPRNLISSSISNRFPCGAKLEINSVRCCQDSTIQRGAENGPR